MNKSDSQRAESLLLSLDYEKASKLEEADLVMVNACSVRQSAIDRIYGLFPKFEEIRKKNKNFKVIITGCLLPIDRKKMASRAEYILNIKDMERWPLALAGEKIESEKGCSYLSINPEYENKYSVFVPISSGCSNYCTYCAVPYTRGELVCRDHKEILLEIESALKNQAKEIWLLGENVNDYKSPSDESVNFENLLKSINDMDFYFWLRFTSPHPKDFSNSLVETMSKCKKLTPYLNLPAQSGDDQILRKMNRPYKIEAYKELVEKLRRAFSSNREGLEKELSLSTDIIVGFPGETKEQFENTASLLKEIEYDMAYIARYSKRDQTQAPKMNDDVSESEKKKREKILTGILEKTSLKNNEKFLDQKIDVLVSGFENNFCIGKSRHFKTVKFKSKENLIGRIVTVKIDKALIWGLEATLL